MGDFFNRQMNWGGIRTTCSHSIGKWSRLYTYVSMLNHCTPVHCVARIPMLLGYISVVLVRCLEKQYCCVLGMWMEIWSSLSIKLKFAFWDFSSLARPSKCPSLPLRNISHCTIRHTLQETSRLGQEGRQEEVVCCMGGWEGTPSLYLFQHPACPGPHVLINTHLFLR